METPDRRRSDDRGGKRLFEYERSIVMAVGALVMGALAWNANRIVELGVAMEQKASRDGVAASIGNLTSDVIGLKLNFAFEKESVDRRLGNLERYIESQRSMRETGRAP